MRFIMQGYGVVIGSVLMSVHQLHDHASAMVEHLESEHGCSCSIEYLGGALETRELPVVLVSGEEAEQALIAG